MKKQLKTLLLISFFISTNSYALEIIPLLGYRAGGNFIDETTDKKHTINSSATYGVIISDEKYGQGKSLDLYYNHQSSNLSSINVTVPNSTNTTNIPLSIDYLHLGGTTPISNKKNINSFVSGGLGFTYFSPDFTGLQSDLRLSLSLGIGLKWPITDEIALRIETRGLATFFNNNAAIFCNSGCTITVSGSLFLQTEVFAGMVIKF